MKTIDYDLRFVRASLDVLADYLLSDEVFWPLGFQPPEGKPDYPQLTLGALLLSTVRLSAYPKSSLQKNQADQLFSEMDRIRSKWRVAWEKKAGRSFSVRLRMWRDFIGEYRNAPQENADRYPYEVRLRAMLTLLQKEGGGELPAEQDLLTSLDGYLQEVLVMDGFIWEVDVQSGFPKNGYWYLYGKLPSMGVKK